MRNIVRPISQIIQGVMRPLPYPRGIGTDSWRRTNMVSTVWAAHSMN